MFLMCREIVVEDERKQNRSKLLSLKSFPPRKRHRLN